MRYHDLEWGVPVRDDRELFAKLMLDGFQAGLSWITVLRKRPAFEEAFWGWDPERIARATERDQTRLLNCEGIIRSRAKIKSSIGNAQAYLRLMESGGPCDSSSHGAFSEFLWQHVGHRTLQPRFVRRDQVPANTAESQAMSKALRAAGFKFCGPTICYAFMQAVGMTNDHLRSCWRHGG